MRWFKYFFLISLFGIMFIPYSVAFSDGLFSFSTEPQNIAVSVLSEPITIHSESDVTETTYITLSSTSATGQFFSNKTTVEPIQQGSYVYISTNNQNRTVYYKDVTAGEFVITAKIYNKEKTTKIGEISQKIIVGSESSMPIDTGGEESESGNSSSGQTSNTSAHSSPSALSGSIQKMELEVYAGRERLTVVGNSIEFRAVLTKSQNIPEQSVSYFWSFGDGTIAQGSIVNHTYRFAGEYSVVLNANYSDKQAVSRTKVKVIEPELTLERRNGGVEIKNNSKNEINLGAWSILSGTNSFAIPNDTLVPAGEKIVIADEVTHISSGEIKLVNPLNKEIASVKKEDKISKDESTLSNQNVQQLQSKIEEVKIAISQIKEEKNLTTNQEIDFVSNEIQPALVVQMDNLQESENFQNSAIVFEAEKESGIISKIFALPIKGMRFFERLFIEE